MIAGRARGNAQTRSQRAAMGEYFDAEDVEWLNLRMDYSLPVNNRGERYREITGKSETSPPIPVRAA